MDWIALIYQIPAFTIIDYLGVFVGVIAGSLFAIEKKLDIMGTISLGIITGWGGGIIRDLLLQNQGVFFMEHPLVILAGIGVSIVIWLCRNHLFSYDKYLFHLDAFIMAWYALAGASKCWYAGAGAVISVILGSVTAVGGGMLRDICTNETPRVFKPGSFYGVSSVVGSIFYVIPAELGFSQDIASILCVAVGFGLTVASRRFGWHTE